MAGFFIFDLGQYLSLASLNAQQASLNAQVVAHPWLAAGLFFVLYVAVTALSLPSLIMLKRVVKLPLLATFTGVVTVGILTIGFTFNAITNWFI
jgi:uncharacterized membrane protein YraQ (UPF0718 family)